MNSIHKLYKRLFWLFCAGDLLSLINQTFYICDEQSTQDQNLPVESALVIRKYWNNILWIPREKENKDGFGQSYLC